MGKMQRNKGANYERAIARRLRPFFPQAERNLTETRTGQGAVFRRRHPPPAYRPSQRTPLLTTTHEDTKL